MNELFAQVLQKRDLSKAGELFSLADDEIKDDLVPVLEAISKILDCTDYLQNDNDQSVVEICITRVTTAIRETGSIEAHSKCLVSLLEVCQKYDLNPAAPEKDPPHAKIASDIMSCLFMHYSKPKVMSLAIPVVVNFLRCNNKELTRNVSSYLSLAALDNADTLAKYVDLIISTILRGNYFLSTVLPQIYSQNKQPIINSIDKLTAIINVCDVSERASLFQVFGMISKHEPTILEPHIDEFCKYLSSSTLAALVLMMFVDMATANPKAFVDYLPSLKDLAEQQPMYFIQVIQIIGAIGNIDQDNARRSMVYFVSCLGMKDQTALAVILQEIKALSINNHSLLEENIIEISKLSQSGSSAVRLLVQQLKDDLKKYANNLSCSSPPQEKETRSVSSQTEGQVTVITVGNPHNAAYPSGAVSVRHTAMSQSTISSQQSIPKSLRNSSSNTRHERPVSPASTILSDRLSLGSLLTVGSTQTGPPLLAEPIRDGIQHFCEKHMTSIRNFICQFSARIPIPAKCGIINGRHRQYIRLFFLCGDQKERCIYGNSYFTLDTKVPKTWIHLMFLAIQAQSTSALSQNDPSISSLKTCLEAISERGQNIFLTIVTSSFPSAKDQDLLIQELNRIRFFDVFEFNAAKKHWACFVCNHPEKVGDLLQDGVPVIAGQLKEKKGKWKFLKRWKTRYFTLSGAHMTYNKSDHRKETLPVSKIQSVKAVRKGIRDIPKAFEIFTGDETYTFKAKGQQNIEQWVQCLHIAVAQVQNKDDEKKSTKMVPMPSHVNPLNQENVVIERPRSVMDTKL
ncbi:ventricular zone-expressed PH domain-containing protein homolog 1-like isoform X1 [Mytilus trossulus]|uniref:ventricular zone-expressed PH domain-containing protein homolog 1-like isoform X1 n=1 Tax=Mytilus trossulus TaxID=6551 RepID=UPI003006BBCF